MFELKSSGIFLVAICCLNLVSVETVYLPILLDRTLGNAVLNPASVVQTTLSIIGDNDKVKFFCFKPHSKRYSRVYLNDTDYEMAQHIVFNKPLALLVHGWIDRFDSIFLRVNDKGWMERTSRDWAKYGDTNVCAVDWNALGASLYSVAARRTKYVGRVVGKFLHRMIELGMPLDWISVAGHSMGSHIAGFAGSYLKKQNLYLNQIYAIDPAGALFTYPNIVDKKERVDPGDARYVQAIHTSIVLGSEVEAGHADFYIDGGISQPGCATRFLSRGLLEIPTICNHFRAVELFQMSLNPRNINRIVGVGLTRSCGFQSGNEYCGSAVENLGIHNRRQRGRFELTTVPRAERSLTLFNQI